MEVAGFVEPQLELRKWKCGSDNLIFELSADLQESNVGIADFLCGFSNLNSPVPTVGGCTDVDLFVNDGVLEDLQSQLHGQGIKGRHFADLSAVSNNHDC